MSKPKNLFLLLVLVGAWMLPGVVGRDPWKADEAYTFGLVLNIVETGDHVVPKLAGEPFMQKPPLFFSTAAVLGKLFSPVFDLRTGARLATAFYLAITLLALGLIGREVNGTGNGWWTPVLFMGSLGLDYFHIAHMLITDVLLVCGFAVATYGLLLVRGSPIRAGIVTGTGIGIAFMSKGLLGPGLIGVTMLLMPLLFRAWRTKEYLVCLAITGLAVLPWVLIWPCVLYAKSPALFNEWFIDNNFGRFLGASKLGLSNKIGMNDSRCNFVLLLPAITWPAFPLGCWLLWKERKAAVLNPNVQLPLIMLIVVTLILTSSRNGRSLYGLPLTVPASVLGALGIKYLSERFAAGFYRVALALFGFAGAALWLGWLAFTTGQPAFLWQKLHAAFPDFERGFHSSAFVAGSVLTVLWIGWMWKQQRDAPANAVVNWTVGLSLGYGLVMTLWLPVLESNMSYRHLAPLRSVVPQKGECVASIGLGEPQRAMLHYYAGLQTVRQEEHPDVSCNWFLVLSDYRVPQRPLPPGGPWELVWESVHSRKELFRLFRKTAAK